MGVSANPTHASLAHGLLTNSYHVIVAQQQDFMRN